MKSILPALRIGHIKIVLGEITERFPVSVLLVLMVSSILAFVIATDSAQNYGLTDILMNIVISGAITFFLSTSLYLL